MRLLDWGDASVSHPFASLVVTFRFLEERNQLSPGDPWFARLRDAYRGRQRDHLPQAARPEFDKAFAIVLRRAVARTIE